MNPFFEQLKEYNQCYTELKLLDKLRATQLQKIELIKKSCDHTDFNGQPTIFELETHDMCYNCHKNLNKKEIEKIGYIKNDKDDYNFLLEFLYKNLSTEQLEYLSHADEQQEKDANWNNEKYDLPFDTSNGTFIDYNNYYLVFDDNKKYIGYVWNMEANGFTPDKFNLDKIRIKLAI